MSPHGQEVRLDFDRRRRIGLDEAILAASKSSAQLEVILSRAEEKRTSLLLTRLSVDQYEHLSVRWAAKLDYCPASRTAFFGAVGPPTVLHQVAIVTGGSSDIPVAREAERTLAYHGYKSRTCFDVGVAGLWRLLDQIDELRRYPVVIAVAGMDAALPTVLGGLLAGSIIAVPTSVGYGVAAGGHTALNALLASCAQGIAVVNIDNGFGAACAAIRIVSATAWASSTHAAGPSPGAIHASPPATVIG